MRLNWSASVSISSPVCTSMRWLKSLAPSRNAPACSARIGTIMRRARIGSSDHRHHQPHDQKPAETEQEVDAPAPAPATAAARRTRTNPCAGIGANAVSTRRSSRSRPIAAGWPPARAASTCGSLHVTVPGAMRDSECISRRPRRSDHIGVARLADLRAADQLAQEREVDFRHRDAGVAAGMRHGDRHERLAVAAKIGRAEPHAARRRLGEARDRANSRCRRRHDAPARHAEPLAPAAIDVGELVERRHLLQDERVVAAVLLHRAGARARRPADLALDLG